MDSMHGNPAGRASGMEIRYVTPAAPLRDEGTLIARMLERGVAAVHLRHPEADWRTLRRVLDEVPRDMHPRIALHDRHEMALDYGCMVHLNARHPEPPAGWDGVTGRSCHTLDEVERAATDYVTLSPFFDSISKPGYRGVAFDAGRLRRLGTSRPIVALGGITPARLGDVAASGLCAVALSGYLTGDGETGGIMERVAETVAAAGRVCRTAEEISGPWKGRMQFITHRTERYDEIEGARLALEGGCRWVQLRMKDAPPRAVAETARRLAPLCHRYGAMLILDDHVGLVRETGADGVHLGREDMPVEEARAILGPGFIIGATANTADDIRRAARAGADYIGLGPYRYTATKKRLSAILGLDGYREIMARIRAEGISLPVVAIGGITLADLPALTATGIDGIALSGAVLSAPDPVAYTAEILDFGF